MIWQDILKYTGAGTTSLFLVITLILNLSGMTYTVPGDQYCTDCYDVINVNSTYWEIKVEHSGERDLVYKKMTRSRTLWVNLDKINELIPTNPDIFVEIMKPTISKYSTVKHPEYGYLRPLKDGDVLIYRKNSAHPNGDRIIVHGITNGQTVKWGLELDSWLSEEFSFDPMWIGTTEGERMWYNSPTPYANESYRVNEFINVSGSNFTLAGNPYKFIGTDSYYITDYATNLTYDDDGNQITNSRQYATELLNEMQYLNINVFRTWAGIQCGGRGSTAWNQSNYGGHYNCFINSEPGNFNETMFKALDWVIYEASKRDIRIMPVLVNNWNDYGGMRWYVQQSPTTDKTYENISNSSDDNFWAFHDQFYNDTTVMEYYKNFTNYTLNRNNTYSGILYKDDPSIFAWMLVNEPRAKTDPLGANDLITNWTKNMTAFIKSVDTNHLVGLGIEGWGYDETWGEGTNFIDNHNGTGVDFATYALHPDQWEYFLERSEGPTDGYWMDTTFNQTSADWWTNWTGLSWNNLYGAGYDTDYSPDLGRHGYQDWVRQHVNWSNQLDMPVILQEVGVKTFHKTVDKDIFYNQTIFNFFETGGDGLLLWTLNHDQYYYSTSTDGDMDDGFGFYVTDDTLLKNKSISPIRALEYALDGGWINILNSFKYDFVLNADLAGIHNQSNISSYAVGNWRFERDSAKDYSGNGNDGVLTGVVNASGIVGGAYEFDGAGDYIVIDKTGVQLGLNDFSISYWIYFNKISVLYTTPIAKSDWQSPNWDGFNFQMGGGDGSVITFVIGNITIRGYKTVSTTSTLTTGKWYHIVGTRNSTDISIFFNGIFEDSTASPIYNVSQGMDLYLGQGSDPSYPRALNGTIDEVLIFNRSLSASEILSLYNESLTSNKFIIKGSPSAI